MLHPRPSPPSPSPARRDHGRARLQGRADLKATSDSDTWLSFVAGERSLLWALLARRIKLRGPRKWLLAFGCWVTASRPSVRPSVRGLLDWDYLQLGTPRRRDVLFRV